MNCAGNAQHLSIINDLWATQCTSTLWLVSAQRAWDNLCCADQRHTEQNICFSPFTLVQANQQHSAVHPANLQACSHGTWSSPHPDPNRRSHKCRAATPSCAAHLSNLEQAYNIYINLNETCVVLVIHKELRETLQKRAVRPQQSVWLIWMHC